MRVAFVNQPMDLLIPPYQNSIGLWTYHVAQLVAEQHQVVVYGKRSKAQKEYRGQENVQYRFIPPVLPNRFIARQLDKWLAPIRKNALPVFASQFYYLDYILQIAMDMRKRKIDVVHIHNFTQFVPVVRALNPDARIVLHMNGEWLSQLNYGAMEKRLQQTDLVLGSSNYIAEKISTRFPKYADRCGTIYNGVNLAIFKNGRNRDPEGKKSDKRLLFVGRVSPEKGVHVLVEAFRAVVKRFPDVRLDIAGPIVSLPREFIVDISEDPQITGLARIYDHEQDYGAYLESLVPEHLKERVRFLGGMPQAELVSYYQAADVLVNPSFSESFGMSLIEAMTCGKPVVATRVGGMVEIVDGGRIGMLVAPGDPAALAGAILTLLEDDQMRQDLGKKGRERVLAQFSWKQVSKQLLNHYDTLGK